MIDTFHFTLSLRRLRDKIALSGVCRERARRAPRPAAAPRARDPLDQRRLRESKRE